MKKFQNRVAMLVSKEQYDAMVPLLEAIGYKKGVKEVDGDGGYLLTMCSGHFYYLSVIHQEDFKDGNVIEIKYNPELFLALAAEAPTDGDYNVGEWVCNFGWSGLCKITGYQGSHLHMDNREHVDTTMPEVFITRPGREAIEKAVTRRQRHAQGLQQILKKIDTLRRLDYINSISLNIQGFEPIVVLRTRGGDAREAALASKTEQEFVRRFTGKGKRRPRRKVEDKPRPVAVGAPGSNLSGQVFEWDKNGFALFEWDKNGLAYPKNQGDELHVYDDGKNAELLARLVVMYECRGTLIKANRRLQDNGFATASLNVTRAITAMSDAMKDIKAKLKEQAPAYTGFRQGQKVTGTTTGKVWEPVIYVSPFGNSHICQNSKGLFKEYRQVRSI